MGRTTKTPKITKKTNMVRVSRSRKKNENDKPLEPGKEPRSFIQVHKLEGTTATYARFHQRADFRRFVMSSRVLTHYLHAFADRTNPKDGKPIQVRQRDVLEYIKDQSVEMQSEEDPRIFYPVQNDSVHAVQRMALSCVQMWRDIEQTATGMRGFDQEEEDDARAQFVQFTKKNIPSLDYTKIHVQSFGPFQDYGESELEPYNRCLTLLMYLNWSMSPQVWSRRFGSSDWDTESVISTDQVPHWMRPRDPSRQTATAPDFSDDKEPGKSKPMVTVRVQLHMKSKSPPHLSFLDKIADEGIDGHLVTKSDVDIRPTTTAAEMRDLVRAKFKLQELKGQIDTLVILPSRTNILTSTWIAVQEELWEEPTEKLVLQMTLRLREVGETLFENEDVPGLSKSVFVIESDDVHIKNTTNMNTLNDDDNGARDGLVNTINSCAGTSVDTLGKMVQKYFKGRKNDQLSFFTIGGVPYDVDTPAGLLAFQQRVHDEVTSGTLYIPKIDSKEEIFGRTKLSAAQLKLLDDAKEDGELACMNLPIAGSEARHYLLDAIHSTTQAQVGLPIGPSATALHMVEYKDQSGRPVYRSHLPGLEKTSFYPYQVSGCATILVSLFGYIPLPDDARIEAREAAKQLRGLAIGGKFLCDQTGMGKSKVFLLVVFFARYHIRRDENGERIYKYNTLAVPSGVIKQWADTVIDEFPTLTLMISYDESGLSEARYATHFVKATAMKKMEHRELWPERHRYIFDESNSKNATTIILTSHDTLVTRTLQTSVVTVREGKRYAPSEPSTDKFDPHEKNPDGTLKHWEIKPVEKTKYHSNQKGRVGIAGADEAHRMKNEETARWKAFSELDADYIIIIGATPMANVGVDAIAQMDLIWPAARRALDRATEDEQTWVSQRCRSMSMFTDGEAIKDPLDPRRLGFLHPPTVRFLLQKGTVVDFARYFRLTADLLCLSRSMSSKIPMNLECTEFYDCKEVMQPVIMRTLEVEARPEEKAEQQLQHREASLRFLQACRASSKAQGKGNKEKIIYPVGEMRELMLTAASTKLRVFNTICTGIGKDTLVDSMAAFRDNGFDGWAFVRFLCLRTDESVPSDAIGYIRFMCEGSPLLRAVIHMICLRNSFLKPRQNGKLFILDDTPLVAMFLHWALNMMGVNATLFHSGLTNEERNHMQEDFNDPKSDTDVMICLFETGGLGRNFHQDCWTGIFTGGGKNQAAEVQGKGRLVRAPQKNPILFTKILVLNTIASYRESRKRDKAIVELATRAHDPQIQSLLVDILNERQTTIRMAQEDPENKSLVEKLQEKASISSAQEQLVAVTAPDSLDLGVPEPVDGKRRRKPVSRYNDNDYDDEGRFIDPDHEPATRQKRAAQDDFDDDEFSPTDSDVESIPSDDSRAPSEPQNTDDDYDSDEDSNLEDGDEDSDDEDFLSSEMGDIPEHEPDSAKEKRKALQAARNLMRDENQEHEDIRKLKLLLTADHSKVYTVSDLENAETLKLALELAYCARTGTTYDRPTSIHIQYSHLHEKLQKAVKDAIKIDEDLRTRLSDVLDRGKKTAPDQSQANAGSKLPTITRAQATDYSTISNAQLRDEILKASCESDTRDWDRTQMLNWLEEHNLAQCKRKHGTDYESWPERYLRMELETTNRTQGQSSSGVVSLDEMTEALKRRDWEYEFIRRD